MRLSALIAVSMAGLCLMAAEPAAATPCAAPGDALVHEAQSGVTEGPRLYLIPGLTAPGAAWDGVRPAFEDAFDVRVLSLAGMGGTPPAAIEGDYVRAQAQAIADTLRADGAKDATLVGHSMGGTIALLVALAAPEAVGRVVVVDSVPFLAPWMSRGMAQTPEAAQQMVAFGRAGLTSGTWEQAVEGLARNLPIQSRDEGFHPQIRAWMAASDRDSVVAALSLLAIDLRADLASLRQPTLVLMAYDEGFTPLPRDAVLAAAKAQYAAAPNVEVRLVEQSRHWIMHDQREAFVTAVKDFAGR